MIDISNKIETLRTAIAESRVIAKKETIERAVKGDTPKGEVLPVARAAGVLAAKKTPELIPYCHPLALDSVKIEFETRGSNSPLSPLKPVLSEVEGLRGGRRGSYVAVYSDLKLLVTGLIDTRWNRFIGSYRHFSWWPSSTPWRDWEGDHPIFGFRQRFFRTVFLRFFGWSAQEAFWK